jgi:hypothetical protein
MAAAIYTLCAVTSALCGWLLARAWWRTRTKLLLWSALCFGGLTLTNLALWIDKLVLPETDLSVVRISIALAAMVVLLFGLIWEAE